LASSLKELHGAASTVGTELLEYDYEIVHRKGALHHVSDALSRMFKGDTEVSLVETIVETELPENTRDP